jgi:hypothetical protein
MNASIIYKMTVNNIVLDELAKELPGIIAEVMNVPGGNLARLKPEQISLGFSQASARDVGSDIRIMAFARSNHPRASTGNDRANAILEKVSAINSRYGEECSVDIRLYLMDIGTAEQSMSN